MKYVVSYLVTAAVFLGVYYVAFCVAALASLWTDGVSTYFILIALAAISGFLGPILLYSEKLNKP